VRKKSSFSSIKNNPITNYEKITKEIKDPETTSFIRKGVM